jgi:hypothetical protein
MNEERIPLPCDKVVHIIKFVTGDWHVWLNTMQDFDGLRIGSGRTREAAIADATEALEQTLQTFS